MSARPHILLLSKGLARYRYDLTEHLGTALAGRAQLTASPLGDDLWEVDFPALKSSVGLVKYQDFPNTWQQLDKLAPDLLGVMEYPPQMIKALLWAKVRGIPVVVFSEVGRGAPKQKQPLQTRLLHSLMAHLTLGQIALSPAACEPFGATQRPILFAPHSVDTTLFKQREWPTIAPEKATILTVAQYIPRKGLDLMAAALAKLYSKYHFTWRIIGVQSPDWLHSVIEQYGLQEQAVVVGVKQGQALIDEFQAADFFVLPSRFDTYGAVAQEAGACGLPLLISRFAGSSANLVKDGANGYIIDPYDTLQFTEKLETLLSHPELWPEQGSISRSIAERYCLRHLAAQMADWLLQHLPNQPYSFKAMPNQRSKASLSS
jgi:glycosyltransferase involved in cell wall biosynthesis